MFPCVSSGTCGRHAEIDRKVSDVNARHGIVGLPPPM
jgi:hypothetical protein